jgi:hypothetical protein
VNEEELIIKEKDVTRAPDDSPVICMSTDCEEPKTKEEICI